MSPDFQDRLVAIVHFDGADPTRVPQNPAVHFQVCFRQEMLSRSKRFIRLGGFGDEVTGWQELDLLVLDEKLGILKDDNVTVDVDALQENVSALHPSAA